MILNRYYFAISGASTSFPGVEQLLVAGEPDHHHHCEWVYTELEWGSLLRLLLYLLQARHKGRVWWRRLSIRAEAPVRADQESQERVDGKEGGGGPTCQLEDVSVVLLDGLRCWCHQLGCQGAKSAS